ncbi:lysozyme inhibitor LprI family protein [Flavicella sediminum]|uniref:lysozyme inhibitor LprI family protein n=1 Tax=Flavicella sediminum TaxID=2585141 RepID=UPI00111CD677|nr:lysozyme inhibitor LprI family protein [Flavicella sediminum]
MNRILFILLLTLNLNSFSQTQAEMNKEAYAEFNESDKQLNEIYKTIISKYKTDTIFVENLKKTQRIWMQFRDAEMEMKYPNYRENIYGSIHPTCRAIYLKELTDDRIGTLKTWIRGTEEGDVCNGSLKIIKEIDSLYMGKAYIEKDGNIWMSANMKKDHRIFGYKNKDIYSTKMILLSIFTNDVENNPFNCKYGAFYDTNGMKEISLKYLSNEGEFLKIEIVNEKEGKSDIIFMLKKWFEFKK